MESEIRIEKYPDGTMGIILEETVRRKYEELFNDKPVNVFVGVINKKFVINLEVIKQDYIA